MFFIKYNNKQLIFHKLIEKIRDRNLSFLVINKNGTEKVHVNRGIISYNGIVETVFYIQKDAQDVILITEEDLDSRIYDIIKDAEAVFLLEEGKFSEEDALDIFTNLSEYLYKSVTQK